MIPLEIIRKSERVEQDKIRLAEIARGLAATYPDKYQIGYRGGQLVAWVKSDMVIGYCPWWDELPIYR